MYVFVFCYENNYIRNNQHTFTKFQEKKISEIVEEGKDISIISQDNQSANTHCIVHDTMLVYEDIGSFIFIAFNCAELDSIYVNYGNTIELGYEDDIAYVT